MPQSVLSFDYGLRHIGVATGQDITGSARPLCQLRAKAGIPNWQEIESLLKEWKPDCVVVGLPLNMDGSESEMSARAAKFARRIHGRFGLPVHLHDERLSSFEARGELLQDGETNFRSASVDARCAALILESWFRDNPGQ